MNFKRILFFLSLILVYLIVKEAIILISASFGINDYFGYIVVIAISIFVIWFGVVPLMKMLRYRAVFSPVRDESKINENLEKRLEYLKTNPRLIDLSAKSDLKDMELYDEYMKELHIHTEKIRNKYVSRLFMSTAVSQNGFLDAILIFSASVNLVKEIFRLYNGRVGNRDIMVIFRKIYYSIAIGGSEGVEIAANEIYSKLANEGIRKIPFLNMITGSLCDGFVNAALLTRVALITENYCSKIYISRDRDLYPSPTFIVKTTKHIVTGSMAMFRKEDEDGHSVKSVFSRFRSLLKGKNE